VNFLNTRNEADQRVFELLDEKFHLFNGVFGASDDVLGVIESGVDIEKRIGQVYQTCRTGEEIKIAFDALQHELDEQIQAKLKQTRESIFDNFDEEVSSRLKMRKSETESSLNERERWLGLHEPALKHGWDEWKPISARVSTKRRGKWDRQYDLSHLAECDSRSRRVVSVIGHFSE